MHASSNRSSSTTPSNNWLVYIIKTTHGLLYTGITNDIERRCQQHLRGKGAKFFRRDPPMALVWLEPNHNRVSASQREYEIKKMRRAQKLSLIEQSEFPAQLLVSSEALGKSTPEEGAVV